MTRKSLKSAIIAVLIIGFISQNTPVLFATTLTISKPSNAAISGDQNFTEKAKTKGKKKAKSKTIKSNPKTKQKSVKAKYKNGDINNKIQISEIFPNPKGKDSNKEWIELHNPTDKTANLGNWQIIQSPSKRTLLPDTLNIAPKSYLTISNDNLKFTLKNQTNLIALKNFQDATIDEIEYKKSQENLSLSKIIIKKGRKSKITQLWTKPSKNSKNPIYYEMEGKILAETSEFPAENRNFFQILNGDNKILTIYSNNSIHSILPTDLLKADTTLNLLAEKIGNAKYRLIDLEIKNSTPAKTTAKAQKETWPYLFLIATGPLIYLLFTKHTKNSES